MTQVRNVQEESTNLRKPNQSVDTPRISSKSGILQEKKPPQIDGFLQGEWGLQPQNWNYDFQVWAFEIKFWIHVWNRLFCHASYRQNVCSKSGERWPPGAVKGRGELWEGNWRCSLVTQGCCRTSLSYVTYRRSLILAQPPGPVISPQRPFSLQFKSPRILPQAKNPRCPCSSIFNP